MIGKINHEALNPDLSLKVAKQRHDYMVHPDWLRDVNNPVNDKSHNLSNSSQLLFIFHHTVRCIS